MICLVCPTGSNLINTIFMQEGTITVVIFASWIDAPAICSCVSVNVFIYFYSSPGRHYGKIKWNVDPVGFNETMSRAVKQINNYNANPLNTEYIN